MAFVDEVCVSIKMSTVQVVKDSVILELSVAVSTVTSEVLQYCLVISSVTDDSFKVVLPSSISLSISFSPFRLCCATTSSCNKPLEQCTDLCKLTWNRLSRHFWHTQSKEYLLHIENCLVLPTQLADSKGLRVESKGDISSRAHVGRINVFQIAIFRWPKWRQKPGRRWFLE